MSTLIETSLSARAILEQCHHLNSPALLYSGTSGARRSAQPSPVVAILAFEPEQTLKAENSEELTELLRSLESHTEQSNLASRNGNRFQSGWLGYFSYDAGVALAQIEQFSCDTPLAEFHYYPFSMELDLAADSCAILNPLNRSKTQVEAWLAKLETCIAATSGSSTNDQANPKQPDWHPGWSKDTYVDAFDRVKQYLLSGDAYQVNLTMPFHCSDDLTLSNPLNLLQRFNAPFSCYFKTDALTLFSVTPERFIRIDDTRMTTSPIKGTIPRGQTEAEDQANKEWLKNSQKNQAENLMIVDLLRNDLGRSAQTGSVNVTRLFDIESHANVHHMVSTIEAQKPVTMSHLEAILNAFPGGSITGAPKKRAMEIIQELEYGPRSLYCGSFGYFDDSGLTDFNILIRSIIATPNGAVCWGGGGLVMDSTADSEHTEIHDKVDRILQTPL